MFQQNRSRRLWAVVASVAFLGLWARAAAESFASFRTVPFGLKDVRSHRELRYDRVFPQTAWWTCGPAAVASLLHFYYDVPTDEGQALAVALEATGEGAAEGAQGGISALALVRTFEAYGFHAYGYRLTPEQLADYFFDGGLPVLLHVTDPEPHYVVAAGMVAGRLVVGDPSWGRRIEPLHTFLHEKGFSGVAVVPVPKDAEGASAGRRRQGEALHDAAAQLSRLARLGGMGR